MSISPDFIHDSWKHDAKKYCPNCQYASSLQVPYCPHCRYGEKEQAMSKTITNEQGGSQSFIEADFDCIPPEVLKLLAECLGFGKRKYGKFNWKKIPIEDNLSHALNHINEWRRGDRSEPHLVNAMARLTFALFQAVDSGQQPDRYIHPDMLEDTRSEAEKPSGNWAHEMALPQETPEKAKSVPETSREYNYSVDDPTVTIHFSNGTKATYSIDQLCEVDNVIPAYAPVKTDFEVRLEKVEEEQRLQVKSLDKVWETVSKLRDDIDVHYDSFKHQAKAIDALRDHVRGIEALAKDNVNSLDNLFREIKRLRRLERANSIVQDALYKDVEQAKQGIQSLWIHYESLAKRISVIESVDDEENQWALSKLEVKIDNLNERINKHFVMINDLDKLFRTTRPQ